MLLVLRILTIVFALLGFITGVILVGLGIADTPSADIDAIWIGIGITVYFLADLYLLYRSYKKNHMPTHWAALLLSILPVTAIVVLLWVLDALDLF